MSESGVEQLPEKWRRRADKAQDLGHTEKAIAVLDCADELEERIDADDDPEIATDGGEPGTEQIEEYVGECRDCERGVVRDELKLVIDELAPHIDDGLPCHEFRVYAVYQDGGERRVA